MKSIEYPGWNCTWHQLPVDIKPLDYAKKLKDIIYSDYEVKFILTGIKFIYHEGQSASTYHTPIKSVYGFDVIWR